MPMATSCSSVSFGSVSFETDTLGSTSFNGWTVLNQRIILGTTSIAGTSTQQIQHILQGRRVMLK